MLTELTEHPDPRKEKAERRLSHRTRVLALLRAAGPAGVSSAELASKVSWRAAARIFDLREQGHRIESRPVPDSEMVLYILEEAKFQAPLQLELEEAKP
jgi:hypothetical protein